MIIQKSICDIHYDLDGSTIDAPVTRRFSIDNQNYEAELCSEHDEQLRALLAPFAEAGRKMKATTRTVRKRQPKLVVEPVPEEIEEAEVYWCACGRNFGTERGLNRHIAYPPANTEGHEAA